MREHFFTGFGFGPIQSGLFANEAFQSGNFSRIVVAEIDQELIDAVRKNNGTYFVNIAKADGIEVVKIDGVELLNPNIEADRDSLLDALSKSTEITTSLPSVSFYTMGDNSAAELIGQGIENSKAAATIIYATENNNRAAEILRDAVLEKSGATIGENVQFLNTAIGKMSRTVTESDEIAQMKLETIAPAINRAFLVEQFNRILVSRCAIKNFQSGIEVFIEKDNLLAFEEAKLYGHNAIHALLAYLGLGKGYKKMTELKGDAAIMQIAEDAFIKESGGALIKKYADLGDELFTESGYKHYAEDLLERMTNPYLEDTTARAGRDIVRKLGCNDRIFGTMILALEYAIEPVNMAIGAAAGLCQLLSNPKGDNLPEHLRFAEPQKLSTGQIEKLLAWLWQGQDSKYRKKIAELINQSQLKLTSLLKK